MYRMTLSREIPTELAKATLAEQMAKLGCVTFPVTGTVTIGRDPTQAQLVIQPGDPQNKYASRRHATVRFDPATGEATVTDHASTNGTFINGDRMQGEHPVANNDVVSLGAIRFKVEIVDLENPAVHTMAGRTLEMTSMGDAASMTFVGGRPSDDEDAGKSIIG